MSSHTEHLLQDFADSPTIVRQTPAPTSPIEAQMLATFTSLKAALAFVRQEREAAAEIVYNVQVHWDGRDRLLTQNEVEDLLRLDNRGM